MTRQRRTAQQIVNRRHYRVLVLTIAQAFVCALLAVIIALVNLSIWLALFACFMTLSFGWLAVGVSHNEYTAITDHPFMPLTWAPKYCGFQANPREGSCFQRQWLHVREESDD